MITLLKHRPLTWLKKVSRENSAHCRKETSKKHFWSYLVLGVKGVFYSHIEQFVQEFPIIKEAFEELVTHVKCEGYFDES